MPPQGLIIDKSSRRWDIFIEVVVEHLACIVLGSKDHESASGAKLDRIGMETVNQITRWGNGERPCFHLPSHLLYSDKFVFKV